MSFLGTSISILVVVKPGILCYGVPIYATTLTNEFNSTRWPNSGYRKNRFPRFPDIFTNVYSMYKTIKLFKVFKNQRSSTFVKKMTSNLQFFKPAKVFTPKKPFHSLRSIFTFFVVVAYTH